MEPKKYKGWTCYVSFAHFRQEAAIWLDQISKDDISSDDMFLEMQAWLKHSIIPDRQDEQEWPLAIEVLLRSDGTIEILNEKKIELESGCSRSHWYDDDPY